MNMLAMVRDTPSIPLDRLSSVDDRSVQVGGKQRICTIDGYAMPLTFRGRLMYLSILGKPMIWSGTQLYT